MVVVFSGCRDESEKTSETPSAAADPQAAARQRVEQNFRVAWTNEVRQKDELVALRRRLQRALQAAETSGDAAEAASVGRRLADVSVALSDLDRRMFETYRMRMTNNAARVNSK